MVKFTNMHDVLSLLPIDGQCRQDIFQAIVPLAVLWLGVASNPSTDSDRRLCSDEMNFGLNRYTSRGTSNKASTMLMVITTTSSRPMSERNFSSERKYQGAMPIVIRTAVNRIALPQVIRDRPMASPMCRASLYSSQIRLNR